MRIEDLEPHLTPEEREFRKYSKAWYRLGTKVPVCWARDKATGVRLLVDPRTYDAEHHELLDEPQPPAA